MHRNRLSFGGPTELIHLVLVGMYIEKAASCTVKVTKKILSLSFLEREGKHTLDLEADGCKLLSVPPHTHTHHSAHDPQSNHAHPMRVYGSCAPGMRLVSGPTYYIVKVISDKKKFCVCVAGDFELLFSNNVCLEAAMKRLTLYLG